MHSDRSPERTICDLRMLMMRDREKRTIFESALADEHNDYPVA
jgi:hypothetical protein